MAERGHCGYCISRGNSILVDLFPDPEIPMTQNDPSYRQLFGNHAVMRDLLRLPWLRQLGVTLDLDTLRPGDCTDLVTTRLRQRRVDILWQARTLDDQPACIQIHVEHQSQPRQDMALRMMTYRGLLYEDLRSRQAGQDTQATGGLLPAMIPIVLYSGIRRWKAPHQIRDLILPVNDLLEPFQPRLKYILLDTQTLTRQVLESTATLGAITDADLQDNLAWLQFRLEHNKGRDDVIDLIHRLVSLTQPSLGQQQSGELHESGSQGNSSTQDVFANWLHSVVLPRSLPALHQCKTGSQENLNASSTISISEVINMLMNTRNWEEQWRQEGIEKGIEKGIRQGQAAQLADTMSYRFGPIPEDILLRLENASPEELSRWARNLLDAKNMEQVFTSDSK